MIFNLFKQLANVAGLPPLVLMCGLVIIIFLTLFGILILIKVSSIKKVLNNLNDRLDIISQKFGWQTGEFDNTPFNDTLGFPLNDETAAVGRMNLETNTSADNARKSRSKEQRLDTEISAKIQELLEKTGKPTPYHDLTKHLSTVYPGYDYDFLLKEVEELQKAGKVEVQLIAGKLYFQAIRT